VGDRERGKGAGAIATSSTVNLDSMNDEHDRRPKDPTLAEIAQRAAAIRAGWSIETRKTRRKKVPLTVPTPPSVRAEAESALQQSLRLRRTG